MPLMNIVNSNESNFLFSEVTDILGKFYLSDGEDFFFKYYLNSGKV